MLSRIIEQIKERKILRWLGIYSSLALTVTGAVNLFSIRYNFPPLIFDSLVILILSGFPSIIIMAWFHGKEGTQKIKRKEIILHSVIAAVAILFLANVLELPGFKNPSIKERSIAVLPFDNLSTLKEDEYFTEGVMEDILTQLAKINELTVISKTSVTKYRESNKTIPEIAKELGVSAVLEGSVRRSGNRVRIVSQLIDTKADKNLWAETYDRELKDIFAIQTEVATQIAEALKARLTSDEKELIEKKSTNSIDAYTYYLKAREYYNLYTNDNNEKAIDLFSKAIRIDPAYALAYAGVADAYAQRVQLFGYEEAWLDSSIKMSKKAIVLEPKLAEGYKALGVIYALRGNFSAAIQEYKKAVELNPNYAPALANLGSMYWWLGKFDQAHYWMKKNIATNPLRALGYRSIALVYTGLLDFYSAEKNFKIALELDPNLKNANADLIRTYIMQGKYNEARRQAKEFLAKFPEDNISSTVAGDIELFSDNLIKAELFYKKNKDDSPEYAYILYKRGLEAEAEGMLIELERSNKEAIESGTNEFSYYYDLARIYSIRGKTKEALFWLSKSVQNGWSYYLWSSKDPLFENIRQNKEFISITSGIKDKIKKMRQSIYKKESI